MKNRNKKVLFALMLGCSITLMATGCDKLKKEPETETEAPTEAPTEKQTETETETEAPTEAPNREADGDGDRVGDPAAESDSRRRAGTGEGVRSAQVPVCKG